MLERLPNKHQYVRLESRNLHIGFTIDDGMNEAEVTSFSRQGRGRRLPGLPVDSGTCTCIMYHVHVFIMYLVHVSVILYMYSVLCKIDDDVGLRVQSGRVQVAGGFGGLQSDTRRRRHFRLLFVSLCCCRAAVEGGRCPRFPQHGSGLLLANSTVK